jgi:hypothetical protein
VEYMRSTPTDASVITCGGGWDDNTAVGWRVYYVYRRSSYYPSGRTAWKLYAWQKLGVVVPFRPERIP